MSPARRRRCASCGLLQCIGILAGLGGSLSAVEEIEVEPLSVLKDRDVHVSFTAEFPNATVHDLPGGREQLDSFVRVFKDELATATDITSSESLEINLARTPPLLLEGRAVFRGAESPFPHTEEALDFSDKLMAPPVIGIQTALTNALGRRGFGSVGSVRLAAVDRPTIYQDVSVVMPQDTKDLFESDDEYSLLKDNPVVLAATFALGGLACASVGVVWWCIVRQRLRRRAAATKHVDAASVKPPSVAKAEHKQKMPKANYINLDMLDRMEVIGSGSFKTVFRGKWGSNDVAIARMRQGGVLPEARLMEKLETHPNLVTFYRWAQDQKGNEYIVMELVRGGSLDKVLRQQAGLLSIQQKVVICDQICQAMYQLTKENVMHRDLAARNVLVQSLAPPCVKVSDFGLSKYVSPNPQVSSGCIMNHLPVRWIPPEVMRHLQWSEKSDVWAFGVTMWEIFSDGKEPYAAEGLTDKEVMDRVLKGDRLPKPAGCPDAIYELMRDCWHTKPSDRPNFTELARRFHVSERIKDVSKSFSPRSDNGRLCSGGDSTGTMEDGAAETCCPSHDRNDIGSVGIARAQTFGINKTQLCGRLVAEPDIALVRPLSWNSAESGEFISVFEESISHSKTSPLPDNDLEMAYPVDVSEASSSDSPGGASACSPGARSSSDRSPLASVPECHDVFRGGTDTRPLLHLTDFDSGGIDRSSPPRGVSAGPYRNIKDVVDGGVG
eukprot:evm.model.scf_1037.5 EVM.evm.TU.scf_1037.5   scf_1037:22658-32305(+)